MIAIAIISKNGDEIIGYIFDTETDGYSEKTEVLVGITTDGQIKGVELGINTRKNQYLASTFDTGLKKQFENIKAQEVELVSEARKKKMIYKLYLVLRYHQNQ